MNLRYTIFIILTFISCELFAQKFEKLVWSDEFNYKGLPDPKKWNYEEGMIRNNEAQYYTKRKENARVQDGVLIIEARKEKYDSAQYTSASVISQGKKSFTYGRIEIRAKIPASRGTWPALWMLGENVKDIGWPECGEIDILENVGYDSLMIHANIHTEAYNHVKKTGKGRAVKIEKPWADFHIYAVEWFPDRLDFYIDDNKYFTYTREQNATSATWPFDKPHYLIMNLAIGGAWGGTKGIYDATFPHRMLIDYVRVYQ